MFDWGIFRERKEFYAGVFGPAYDFDHDHHHIHVRPSDLLRTMQILRQDLGFFLINDIAAVPAAQHGHYRQLYPTVQWDVTYHLFHLEAHQRLQVHLLLAAGEKQPSIAQLFPGAACLEEEACQLVNGVTPNERPLELPRIKGNPNLSETPYPVELHQWYLFDLAHPLTRQQWALAVEADGGRVLSSWLQTGHWKRGLEAKVIGKPLVSVQRELAPLIAAAAPLTNIAWVKTIEDYFQWRIPERAQALRMIFMELARVSHHLHVLGQVAQDLQIDEGLRVCREMRERIRVLFHFYQGDRVTTSLAAFGGQAVDLPAGWVQEASSCMKALENALGWYQRVVASHPLAHRRLRMAGLSAQAALEAGLTGPALRAAGVNFDLRKSRPFYFYQDIDFEVPVGIHGRAHDRVLILLEECRQSLRILWQVIDNLPVGALMIELPGVSELNQGELSADSWQEWWRGAERVWSAQYTAVEGANGELGFHAVLNSREPQLWSLKIKTNSFLLAQAMPKFLQRCPMGDLGLALSTLDIEASAVDR